MKAWFGLVARDLALARRNAGDTLAAVAFFLLACGLFPFGVGPDPMVLARIAAGVVWVAALLAALLPLDRLVGADYEDGTLDQLLVSGLHPAAIAAAKGAVHWLATGVPLLLAAPFGGVMLALPLRAIPALVAALALGTAVLSLLGIAGAALTLGARRGGVLLPLLVLPLTIPVLIFGAAAVEAASVGLPVSPHLAMLGALLAAALPLAPLAAGVALRSAAE
ncbi:heme exporter protein CcmB [Elioraea thermophila]|uniref:heme exporter protein CcmB n=1 Tax=Elioraea thermophila TaxID=2185104 RepID=UPI000DF1AD8F|nr:heme exporter protein CcmB [Elioraea thermophila]